MRYALIGCGRISIKHIQSALANHFEIAAVCDLVPEKAEALLEKAGIREDAPILRYTDYQKMLREVRPELVSIATESGSHAEIALRCIGSGIHTIIEKPMAMSLQDADRIIAAAEESGVTVSVCQQCRFNKSVQAVRHALEEGRFGTLSHGSINVYWNRNRDYYSHDSWRGTWKDDGGCLLNQCIHGADLLRWMMGPEIARVYGATRNHLHPYLETEDVGTAVVEFKNGTIGVLEGSSNVFRGNLEETLYLFGSDGRVKLGGPSANNVEVWDFAEERDADSAIRNLTEPALNVYGHGHARLFADVAEAVRDRRRPYVDVYAGRDALELILAVYMSQKTGQPVELPLKDFGTMDMTGIFGRKSL